MPLHLLDNLSNLSDPVSARSALGLGTTDSPTFSNATAGTFNATQFNSTNGLTVNGIVNAYGAQNAINPQIRSSSGVAMIFRNGDVVCERSIFYVGGISVPLTGSVRTGNVIAYSNLTTLTFILSGRARISSSEDSTITLTNNGVNDFNRLQLGGTSASFPAIKRNGTGIDIRDAADSGYTSLAAGTFVVNNNIVEQSDDFTLSGTDAGKYIRLIKPSGTQTISLTGSDILTGHEFTFYRATSATLALNGGTVNGGSNISSVPQFGAFALKYLGSETFDFI